MTTMPYLGISLLLCVSAAYASDFKICENIILKDGRIDLNKNEKILVCGLDKGPEGWKEIPILQAQLHLRAILQNSGYLSPKFQENEGQLSVWRGAITKITALNSEVDVHVLDTTKKRHIVGQPLVPEKLNDVEAWANTEVRSRGYACPELNVEAHGWDGTMLLKTKLGDKKKFGELNIEGLEGLHRSVIERYQPFEIGDNYDIRKAKIMTDRLLSDGLFQSAFFETHCDQDSAILDLKTSVGKSKIFRFGIGASTEEIPFIDVSFRNARLDNEASSFTTTLHASPHLVSLAAGSELYWLPEWSKVFLGPRIKFAREIEDSYQTDSSKIGGDIGYRWDFWDSRLSTKLGPSLNIVKTARGLGPNSSYPTIDASIVAMSHRYEIQIWQQYEGWDGGFFFRGHRKGLGSQVDVNRYEFNYKYLWNIGAYSPPLFVLGTRFQGITIDTIEPSSEQLTSLIPVEDRIFAGGDDNLRGFPRKSINNGGKGYLNFLSLSFELRLIEELPYHMQPFLLWDVAQLGKEHNTLDSAVYTSEGLGLRWQSPIGTLRGSLAKGKIQNEVNADESYPEQWVLFLSYGQEF